MGAGFFLPFFAPLFAANFLMLERIRQSSDPVLGYRIGGKLTRSELKRMKGEMLDSISRHGHVDLLLELHDIRLITPGAIWEDLKFDALHMRQIGRQAVVGDRRWHRWFAELSRPFIKGDSRYFRSDELESAWTWLRGAERKERAA